MMNDLKDSVLDGLRTAGVKVVGLVLFLLILGAVSGIWILVGGSTQSLKDFGVLIAVLSIVGAVMLMILLGRWTGIEPELMPEGRMRWIAVGGAVAAVLLATVLSVHNHQGTISQARTAAQQDEERDEAARRFNSPANKAATEGMERMTQMKEEIERRRQERQKKPATQTAD